MLCIPVYKYVYIFIIHSFLNVYKQILYTYGIEPVPWKPANTDPGSLIVVQIDNVL